MTANETYVDLPFCASPGASLASEAVLRTTAREKSCWTGSKPGQPLLFLADKQLTCGAT